MPLNTPQLENNYYLEQFGVIIQDKGDITQQLKDALAKMAADGNKSGRLVLPRGFFVITEQINIPKGINLEGRGMDMSAFDYGISEGLSTGGGGIPTSADIPIAGPSMSATHIVYTASNGTAFYLEDLENSSLSNFTLQGPGKTGNTAKGFWAKINQINIQRLIGKSNIIVRHFGGDAITIEGALGVQLSNIRVSDIGGHGYRLQSLGTGPGAFDNDKSITSSVFINLYAAGCTKAGFSMVDVYKSEFVNCYADNCGVGVDEYRCANNIVGVNTERIQNNSVEFPGVHHRAINCANEKIHGRMSGFEGNVVGGEAEFFYYQNCNHMEIDNASMGYNDTLGIPNYIGTIVDDGVNAAPNISFHNVRCDAHLEDLNTSGLTFRWFGTPTQVRGVDGVVVPANASARYAIPFKIENTDFYPKATENKLFGPSDISGNYDVDLKNRTERTFIVRPQNASGDAIRFPESTLDANHAMLLNGEYRIVYNDSATNPINIAEYPAGNIRGSVGPGGTKRVWYWRDGGSGGAWKVG